ncbi:MAG: hypothetical protein QXU52_02280 [Fervidicoccaceae archaeon]
MVEYGAKFNLSAPIYISRELRPGTYEATLIARYQTFASVGEETCALEIALEVTGRPSLVARPLTQQIEPGVGAVVIEVTNVGSADAKEVALRLRPQSPGVTVLQDVAYVGALSTSERKAVEVPVEVSSAQVGSMLTLAIDVSYRGPRSVGYSSTSASTLRVSQSSQRLLVQLDSTQVEAGVSSTVRLRILNAGPGPISGTKAVVQALPPLSLCNEKALYEIGDLSEGSSTEIALELCAPPSSYDSSSQLQVELRFTDSRGAQRTETLQLPLRVTATPPQTSRVLIEVRERELSCSGLRSVELEVTNLLDYVMGDASLTLAAQGLALLNATPIKLGELEPGDKRPLAIGVQVPACSSTSVAALSARLDWRTPWGTSASHSQTLPLTLTPGTPTVSLNVTASRLELWPLQTGNVTIEVSNAGSASLKSVCVALQVASPLIASSDRQICWNELEPGEAATAFFEVIAPQLPGTYWATALATYVDRDGQGSQLRRAVEVKVKEPKLSDFVSVRPDRLLSPGERVVEMTIENTLSFPMLDASLDVKLQGASLLNATPIKLGELEPGEMRELVLAVLVPSYSLRSSGFLSVTLSWTSPWGADFAHVATIPLVFEPEPPSAGLLVDLIASHFTIGARESAQLVLKNAGTSPLLDVIVSVDAGQGARIVGEASWIVKLLEVGESVVLPLEVYTPPSTTSQLLSVTVTAQYKELGSGRVLSSSRSFQVPLRGLVELRALDVSVLPEAPSPGQLFSVVVTLVNTGTSSAHSVIVSPRVEGLPLRLVGSSSVFLGNVDPNRPTTLTLNFVVLNATDILVIPIKLSYYDNLRNPLESYVNVTVKTSHQNQTGAYALNVARGSTAQTAPWARLALFAVGLAAGVAIVFAWKRLRGEVGS